MTRDAESSDGQFDKVVTCIQFEKLYLPIRRQKPGGERKVKCDRGAKALCPSFDDDHDDCTAYRHSPPFLPSLFVAH